MTSLVPTRLSKALNFFAKTSFLLVLVFTLFNGTNLNAQTCLGPYQKFESFKTLTNLTADSWTKSTNGISIVQSTSTRSGVYYAQIGGANNYLQTPAINEKPSSFSFWTKSSASGALSYKVEVFSSTTLVGTYNGTTNTTFSKVTLDATTYYSSTIVSSALPLYFKITFLSGSGALIVDDISWVSTDITKNTIIVPDIGTNACTFQLDASGPSSYNLYDNGGSSDCYNKSQNNTISFKPSNSNTKKIQLTSNSQVFNDGNSTFTVYDGSTFDVFGNPTGAVIPFSSVYPVVSPLSCDGSITIKFISPSTITPVITNGFDVKVEEISYTPPYPSITTTGAATSICQSSSSQYASLTYTAATNSPTSYSIDWNAAANTASLVDQASTSYSFVSSGGTLSTIFIPANIVVGTYNGVMTISNANGCSSTQNITLVINAVPSALISGTSLFCDGANTVLSSNATAGSGTISSYQWQIGGVNVASGGTSATYTATAAGSYTVTVTNSNGCSFTSSAYVVTVNALPTSTVSGNTSFCAGGNTVLSSNATAGSGTISSYQWQVGGVNVASGGTSATYTATVAGSYTVTVTNSNGCSFTSSVYVVTVNALPTSTVSGNTSFCAGGNTVLSSNATAGSGTISSYQWQVGGVNVASGGTSATYTATVAGSYTVTVTNSNGCSFTSSVYVVTVNALPTSPTITPGGPTTFCSGGSVTLTASAGSTYLWSNGATNQAITAITSGSYTVKVTDSNGCQSASSSASTVTVNTIPSAPTASSQSLCSGTVAILSATGTSIQWYATNVSTPALPTSTVLSTTTYYASQTVNGCESTRTPVSVTISSSAANNSCSAASTITTQANGSFTSCSGSTMISAWYAFTPACSGSYTMFLNGFTGDKDLIYYSSCQGSYLGYSGSVSSSELITASLIGGVTYYIEVYDYNADIGNSNTGGVFTLAVTASSVITCLGVIGGPAVTCSNVTNSYTISSISGVTSYTWSVPSGWSIVSGQGSTSITVSPSATGGTISVYAIGTFGTSSTSNLIVSVKPIPALPNAGLDFSICLPDSGSLNGSAQNSSTITVLSQDFNAGPFPTGWTRSYNRFGNPRFYTSFENTDTGSTWPPNGYTGYCSYFDTYNIRSGRQSSMISPVLNLSTYTASTLTFWIYNSDGIDSLAVYANNNGGTYTQVGTTYYTYGSWTQITISLNGFVGPGFNAVSLAFTGTSDNGYSNIGIDDIVVTATSTVTNSWSSSPAGFTSSSLTPTISPLVTTTYTLSSTYGNGCFATDDLVVSVGPKPTVSISSPTTNICINSVTPITASGTGTTYSWTSSITSPNTLFTDASATTTYTGQNLTTIYVKSTSTVTITALSTIASTSCSASASITLTVLPGIIKTWSGSWSPAAPTINDPIIISGNYSAGSLQGCNCLVNSGTVVFNSGETLSLVNELKITGGTVTFENSSSLLQTNNVANTGNINYKRTTKDINRYDYNYWSTPVSPQTLSNLSPLTLSDKYFYFDAAITNYWANIASSATMTPGKGYIIRGPQNYDVTTRLPFTGTFVGVPNNGTITTPTIYSGTSEIYNLIGNPYPSALDANLFLRDPLNIPVVDGTIYLWTHNTPVTNLAYNYSDYAVYNYLGGTATYAAPSGGLNTNKPNGYIASGEAFFIKGLTTGGVATFKNSMRIAGNNNQFFKNSATPTTVNTEEKHRIWLGVNDLQGSYKETLVGYVSGATSGLDRGFDGELLSQTQACIYTLAGTTALSIQGRPLPFEVSDEVPVGFHADTDGTFTISLVDFDGLFSNQDIYLEDKLLNVIQDIKASNYSFASNSGTFDNRFVLRYTNSALNTNATIFSEESVIVFKNNQKIMVNAHNTILDTVEIFDIRGRELFKQKNINSSQFEVTNFISSQEILLVRVTSVDGRIVTKKIIY